ncbi:MAG: hypothetical protein WCR47_04180 [Desulfoplanes sp.]|nr:hypothetical protein [Desulfoplanes sp.]
MPHTLYPPIVYTAIGFFGLSILLTQIASQKLARTAHGFGTALCGILVAMLIWSMQRLPLFGAYEALIYTTFLIGLLEAFLGKNGTSSPRQTLITGVVTTLILLPLVFRSDLFPRPNFFIYSSPLVTCFFFCRLTALGIFGYAGISYITATVGNDPSAIRHGAEIRGRNFLLLGSVVFLISEFAGSMWCYAGWGDSWRWSGNFFRSTMFFLLIMLGLHIPSKWKHARAYSTLIGGFTCMFIIASILIRQLME